jgi:osmotically-inducible protein OsmY
MRSTILMTLLLAGTSFAGVAAGQRAPSEVALRQAIEARLATKSIHGVIVSVSDRNVTLTGAVPSLWEKTQAREQAWEANALGAVFDELSVLRGTSDKDILNEVVRRIRHFVFFTIFDDVEIGVTDGIVTLDGAVTQLFKAGDIAELTSRVTGVQDVRNRIQRTATSPVDIQLRYAIARRIYGDPLFWDYAIGPDPPVHIMVSGGRVTLIGAVHSEAERCAAERIVRETIGVSSYDNQLQLDGDR